MKITFRKIDCSFLQLLKNRSLFCPILYIFYVSVFQSLVFRSCSSFLCSFMRKASNFLLPFAKFASCHICFSVCCYYFCPLLASRCDWSDLYIQIHCIVAQYMFPIFCVSHIVIQINHHFLKRIPRTGFFCSPYMITKFPFSLRCF